MKNVLFIVYYFPPMGGSGVQRPLKFVKYLSEFGWNPIVLCPEPGAYHTFDSSLQEELEALNIEIHRVRGNTPFHRAGQKKKEIKVPGRLEKILRKLSSLFYIPDNKKGWIKPALSKAIELIAHKDIDLIFSTAPPFSNHIVGAQLKDKTGIPLVLDYRDSWSHNQFFTGMYDWQKRKMKQLEKACVSNAEIVIGLDEVTINKIKDTYSIPSERLKIVEHGYDPDDFNTGIPPTLRIKEGKFNLLYSGTFVEHNQPDTFLKGVAYGLNNNLFTENDFHLHFQGGLNKNIRNLISELGLENYVSEYPYLDHKIAVANLKAADALWVLENYDPDLPQIKNGKLFEYFGSGKPILGVLNPGVSENLIKEYEAGFVCDVKDKREIAKTLDIMIKHWENDSFSKPNHELINYHDRKILTQKLAQIFDKISSQ